MTTPTGTISASNVNTELGRASNAPFSLNQSAVRTLAGVASGQISFSQLRGKSNTPALSAVGVNDYNSFDTSAGPGTASVFPSINPSGGNGTYSYLWSITSQGGMGSTLSGATNRTPIVSRAYNKNETGSFYTTLQCVVTSGGQSITITGIIASADWAGSV